MLMNLGDLVVRKSYGGDITFRVEDVRRENIIIKGTEFRLLADSPADDLVKAPYPAVSERTKQARIKASESLSRLEKHKQEQSERQLASLRNEWGQNVDKGYFDVPGKVLHLDGDPQYLKKAWHCTISFGYRRKGITSMNRPWRMCCTICCRG